MADRKVIKAGSSGDRTVEISGDEASKNTSGLDQKIADLEKENGRGMRKSKEYKKQIEELKASVNDLSAENAELKAMVGIAQSENKVLQVAAARAAELETEVSKLRHDLALATSNLQESTVELSNLKSDLEGMKGRKKEKDVKLEASEKEKALLMAKVETLAGVESSLRDELQRREKEIQVLKNNVEEFEAVVGSNKSLERSKNELEKTIEEMKGEIRDLKSSLAAKEKEISGFETKERAVVDGVRGRDALVEGGKKESIGGAKQTDLTLIGGSTIAAIAVIGAAYCFHAASKH